MTDFLPYTSDEYSVDAPATALHFERWFRNWEAGFQGAFGAQRLYGEAIARGNGFGLPNLTITAADTYTLNESADEGLAATAGTMVSSSTSFVLARRFDFYNYSGSVRAKASHAKGDTSGATITLELRKNGVVVQTFTASAGSTSPVARVVDVSIAPGDYLEWWHKTGAGTASTTVSLVSMTANKRYTTQSAIRVEG